MDELKDENLIVFWLNWARKLYFELYEEI